MPDALARAVDWLAATDRLRAPAAERVVTRWAQQDLERALSWSIANAHRLETALLSSMASYIAAVDPPTALDAIGRVPEEKQPGWIEGVATGLFESDPATAVALVERLSSGPHLEQAVDRIGSRIENPALRARLARHLDENGLGDALPPPAREP